MKKLFLSSSFADVTSVLADFAGKEMKGKSVTFIPTAALHQEINFYVESGKKALQQMGLIVDELELSSASFAEASGKLRKNDYIYITGGNTFFLLQELQKSKADKLIVEQINLGKLYIGESAGSIVLAPNIEYAKGMDNPEEAPTLKGFDALHAVDFYPLPHYTNDPFKEATETILAEYGATLPLKPISNAQAILVQGGLVEVR